MTISTPRRRLLGISGALLAYPTFLCAQTCALVVGGAASMAGYMKGFVFPVIEKAHNMHAVFDGIRSLILLPSQQRSLRLQCWAYQSVQ